jgi:hypothetical protein
MYIHSLGHFSLLAPNHSLYTSLPTVPGRTCLSFFSNFVGENNNFVFKKKDKPFLLVEIRIAIHRDS